MTDRRNRRSVVDGMATRTTSLAATFERMLQYFLDLEDRNRKEAERERSASP